MPSQRYAPCQLQPSLAAHHGPNGNSISATVNQSDVTNFTDTQSDDYSLKAIAVVF
jgi:hypothetical protein